MVRLNGQRRAEGIQLMTVLMASYGIDSREVCEDDFTEVGYYRFVRDGQNNPVFDYDAFRMAREWVEWPEGFPLDDFMDIYRRYYL